MPTIEKKDDFRDRIATVDKSGKRKWIFAKKPKGKFYNIRTWVSLFFFGIFILMPFLRYQGQPLFLFNIPQAKFILFGKVFWPQDFFIFGVGMITFIIIVVLFTAAFGRLFCGWVCPQTNFMEMLFRKLEYWVEGDAPAQQQLQKQGWSAVWIRKKTIKHLLFFLISFLIANIFLAYVIGTDELFKIATEPISEHFGGFLSLMIFTAIFYTVYAYFREQACTVVCPYGRLQGVLLDRNSMVVAYDYKRGEPRAKFKKIADPELGDCIDCFQCVKVCPTGIDIRNGTQMECVGCTACIDACNEMMAATHRPLNLIRYASENGIAEGKPLRYTGRMKFYTLLLVVLVGLLSVLLITRKNIDGTIVRAPGMLFQERGADSLSNLYTIRLINKTMDDIEVELRIEGQGRVQRATTGPLVVKKEAQGTESFFIVLPRTEIRKRKLPVSIALYGDGKKIGDLQTSFMGPFTKN